MRPALALSPSLLGVRQGGTGGGEDYCDYTLLRPLAQKEKKRKGKEERAWHLPKKGETETTDRNDLMSCSCPSLSLLSYLFSWALRRLGGPRGVGGKEKREKGEKECSVSDYPKVESEEKEEERKGGRS